MKVLVPKNQTFVPSFSGFQIRYTYFIHIAAR